MDGDFSLHVLKDVHDIHRWRCNPLEEANMSFLSQEYFSCPTKIEVIQQPKLRNFLLFSTIMQVFSRIQKIPSHKTGLEREEFKLNLLFNIKKKKAAWCTHQQLIFH